MRVLGIDTATRTASVGVVDDGGEVVGERTGDTASSHAVTLLPLVEVVLAATHTPLREIGLLAISIGPGSFTGVRVAVSVAKGLALATGIPIVGVPTLEALALAAGPRSGVLWPLLDARKGEVYAAAFRVHGDAAECVHAPMVVPPARLVERLEPPCTLVGEGVASYASQWPVWPDATVEMDAAVSPSGAVVARLGLARWRALGADGVASLEPTYVRTSDAERRRLAGEAERAERRIGRKIDRVGVVG